MSGTPAPMASYRALGRLLLVGTGAGALIGAVVGAVATAWTDGGAYGSIAAVVGALAGIPLGLLVQAAAFAVLLGARRVRPGLGVWATTGVVAVLPVLGAGAAGWLVTAAPDVPLARQAVVALVAVTLAVVVVAATAPWCLAPVVGRSAPSVP